MIRSLCTSYFSHKQQAGLVLLLDNADGADAAILGAELSTTDSCSQYPERQSTMIPRLTPVVPLAE